MPTSQALFEAEEALHDRIDEVEMYFTFVATIVKDDSILLHKTKDSEQQISFPIDSDLKRTLMAIGYVVLYNFIESTLRNYISAIYEDMLRRGARIEQTRENVRKLILKGFKKHMTSEFCKKNIKDLGLEIIDACWDKKSLFSGNVDQKEIKAAAERYGFKLPGWSSIYKNGETLTSVKDNRNSLAHGEKSFRECVQNESIDELLSVKKQVVRYLEVLAANIADYITKQEYLVAPLRHAPSSSPR